MIFRKEEGVTMSIFHKAIKVKFNQLNQTEERLRQLAYYDIDSIYEELDSNSNGLSNEQAEERLDEYGVNKVSSTKEDSLLHRLADAFINPFNIVLIIIALVTYFTDVVISKSNDYLTIIIILSLILLSSLVAFYQNEKSKKAADALFDMISNKADVIRDGKDIEISIEDIVPGDIIRLSSGDMIPGDVIFISTKDTFVSQSALTGESELVEKFSSIDGSKDHSLTDLENLGFMGSNVVSGFARAIVIATGNNTYIGSMAKTIASNKATNAFERGVDSVSKLLVQFMIVMVPLVFIINGLNKGDWVNSLLFAISIAVGLTPEMLPVIMTSTLAKGAISMAKHKVIVKQLGAIQTFGEMDILCTDKTGTLTEDRIVLEKYMNVLGNDDDRILKHAFLNSYFQTGLKNLIDVAIINRADTNGIASVKNNYKLVDEIPFDFTRRRMSVVVLDKQNKRQLITKGAVEEISDNCSHVEIDGKVQKITPELKDKFMATYQKYNNEGLRMIAVAQKNNVPDEHTFDVDDETDMVLLGFIGFLDPPKESAKQAIQALRNHGVKTVVITGDSEGVAIKVCKSVGIDTSHVLLGIDVEKMSAQELHEAAKTCCLFAKQSPSQKERIVKAFQELGHTVGYMGDGINDALPLNQSDVGISVDSGVDIAKETADIILLEKDLLVLEQGVVEGRKTFANIIKYIKMAASGNFGNMFSVVVASIFLPFLPMLPIHILTQNLLSDFAQMGMPFDNVDEEYLSKPRRWDTNSIKRFMFILGPISSIFDILCFAIMWWIIKANTLEHQHLFQAGWFVLGTISQIVVIYTIRTEKIPFIQSRPSLALMVSTLLVIVVALILGFSHLGYGIELETLPLSYGPWLALLLIAYSFTVQIIKRFYIKKYGEWL